MNRYGPRSSHDGSLADRMERRPFASRILIMVVLFLLLIPIAGIVRGTGGNVVKAGGLPGAAVANDPFLGATTTTVAVAAAPVPTTAAAPATVATTPPPLTAAAEPETTEATSPPTTAAKKTTATTAKKTTSTTAKKTTSTAAKKTTTAAPKATTTEAPAPKETSPPSTEAPAPKETSPPTTEAPAPAAAPPANGYSKEEVEAIIRSIWPAELADEAVRIAKRESSLVPTVRNWCCYGLFQIYFEVNKKTLSAVGVTAAEQLYDPHVNAQAAYYMYQRSGWGPWKL
jgi:hypothetical protein